MEFNLQTLKALRKQTDKSHFYYPPVLVQRWIEGFEKRHCYCRCGNTLRLILGSKDNQVSLKGNDK